MMTKRGLNIEDIIGKRYGRLVVSGIVNADGCKTTYICKCDCGGTKVSGRNTIRGGNVRSCGCLSKELAIANKNKLQEARGRYWDKKKQENKIKDDEQGKCPYPTETCVISEVLRRCCYECTHYENCYKRCENTPDKCGANKRRKR